MANRERGIIDVQIDGRTYTFCLDLNALIELEEMFSTPERRVRFVEVLALAEAFSAKHLRAVFWAALRKHHPEMTVEDVGGIVNSVSMMDLQHVLTGANAGATPDPKDVQELNEGLRKRPRKAQTVRTNGTGESSTSRPAASV